MVILEMALGKAVAPIAGGALQCVVAERGEGRRAMMIPQGESRVLCRFSPRENNVELTRTHNVAKNASH